MGSDKILIILALLLIITLITFIFRKRITEEIQLFRQSEVKKLIKNASPSQIYFYPLSQQERKEALTEHIENMKAIQKRVSKTFFAKYFVDFSDYILEKEKELQDDKIETLFAVDAISFITGNYNTVTANTLFAKEPLLKVGFLIDETFPEKESNDATYTIDVEDDCIIVNIFPLESVHVAEEHRYQEFVNQVSKEAFDNDPVSLHVILPDSEKKLIFKSNIRP